MSPRISQFAVTTLTLAALATALVAPAAEAGRRYKRHDGPVSRVHHPKRGNGHGHGRVVEVHQVSSTGAVLAGIIGGIAIGAVLANASDCPPRHAYVDPYCGERFTSLDVYHSHFRYHPHPKVVRVIEVDSGQCVNTYRYSQGRWCDAEEWHGH